MTALYNEPALHSRPVSYGMSDQSRRGSTSSLDSTDDDVITPCPLEKIDSCRMRTEHTQATSVPDQARPQTDRPKSWRDKGPHFNPLDSNSSDDTDRTLLWRTMLAIQRTFGCYNSARMRAALEMGDMAVPVRKSRRTSSTPFTRKQAANHAGTYSIKDLS
jgi:hypothetical protein